MAGSKLAEAFIELKMRLASARAAVKRFGDHLKSTLPKMGLEAGRRLGMTLAAGLKSSLSFAVRTISKTLKAGLLAGVGLAVGSTLLASGAEEAASKFKFVFGSAVDETTEKLNDFAKSTGRGRSGLRDMAASFGSLLGPMGFTKKQTSEMSVGLAKLSTDLSSFFDTSDSESQTALFSGLLGESEPLRRYGVQLSAARVEQEALRRGLAKTKDEITPQIKAFAAYQLILKDTKQAQGDAARTSGGFANTLRSFLGVLKDVGIEIGKIFLPLATRMVANLRDWAQGIGDHRETFAQWGKTVLSIGENIGKLFQRIFSGISKAAGVTSGGVVKGIGGILKTLSALTVDWDLTFKLLAVSFRSFLQLLVDSAKEMVHKLSNALNPIKKVDSTRSNAREMRRVLTGDTVADAEARVHMKFRGRAMTPEQADAALQQMGFNVDDSLTPSTNRAQRKFKTEMQAILKEMEFKRSEKAFFDDWDRQLDERAQKRRDDEQKQSEGEQKVAGKLKAGLDSIFAGLGKGVGATVKGIPAFVKKQQAKGRFGLLNGIGDFFKVLRDEKPAQTPQHQFVGLQAMNKRIQTALGSGDKEAEARRKLVRFMPIVQAAAQSIDRGVKSVDRVMTKFVQQPARVAP